MTPKKGVPCTHHMAQESRNQKILIIEDDTFLGELMAKHFKEEGFDIYLALDAETGLEKLRAILPDLVILDLLLPGMDGYEFLKIVKADSKLSSVPVIILSNFNQKDDIERGLKIGAIDFLVKAHLDLDEITEKIKQVLNKKPNL